MSHHTHECPRSSTPPPELTIPPEYIYQPRSSALEFVAERLGDEALSAEARLAYQRRQFMLEQVAEEAERMRDPSTYEHRLWDEQITPYQKTLEFLGSKLPDIVSDEQELSAGGYLRLPTGFGKGILEYKAFDIVGVGKKPAPEQPRIRGLYLVPTLAILDKVMGRLKDSIGLAEFLPHISVSDYWGENKDLTGDVVVMTYDSFRQPATLAILQRLGIDIVVCDEAHALHASVKKAAIQEFRPGKFTLGYSATTEYVPHLPLTRVLPHEIASYTTRDAIERDVLSGVQILGFWTGCSPKTGKKRVDQDYTEKELRPLAEDTGRNNLILDLATIAIESGRRVVISAIPGGRNAHAHLLADLAAQRMVIDPATGKSRPMVPGVAERRPRTGVPGLAAWHDARLDLMTFTNYINQGWDSHFVNAMIMARPTRRQVFGAQGRGRGLRKDPRHPLTVYFELLDDMSAGQYTMWHELGEDMMPNTIVASGTQTHQGIDGMVHDDKLLGSQSLPAVRRTYTALYDEDIRETIVTALVGEYPPPPAGWVPVPQLASIYTIDSYYLRQYLEQRGFNPQPFRMPVGAPAYHVPAEAATFLAEGGIPDIAERGDLTRLQVAKKLGTTLARVELAIAEYKIESVERRSRVSGQVKPHFGPAEQGRIRAWLRQNIVDITTPREDKPEIASDVAKALGISVTSINYYLRNETIDKKRAPATGLEQAILSKDQADRVRAHFEAADPPDTHTSMTEVARKAGSTLRQVREALRDLSLSDETVRYKARETQPGQKRVGASYYDKYLPHEDADKVVQLLKERRALPTTTVGGYAKSRGIKSATVLRAANRLGLELQEVQRGSIVNRYLTPYDEYTIDRHIGAAQPKWYPISDATRIARASNTEMSTMIMLLGLGRYTRSGEETFVADEAVAKLYDLATIAEDGFGDLSEIQADCLTVFGMLLPVEKIHAYIWGGERSIAKFVRIARDEQGMLRIYYRQDFIRALVNELRYKNG